MNRNRAVLTEPLDAIIFDCDGTLSRIEGIDALAEQNGVGEAVKALTRQAMSQGHLNVELYEKRLNLVLPKQQQVAALADLYYSQRVHHLDEVVATFQQLGKKIYIVSGGFYPAVLGFAKQLGIETEHVFAVDVYFNERGDYHDFDRQSPLVRNDGKQHIVRDIKNQHPRLGYLGDGFNDLCAKPLVTRFIGYGGVFHRPALQALCDFYVTEESLASLLPLCLTEEERIGSS